MESLLRALSLAIFTLTLNACGGGSGETPPPSSTVHSSTSSAPISNITSSISSTNSSTPAEGKIEVLGKLSGMSYATATQSGKVDNLGFISANQGDTVQFSLGEKELGNVVISADFITPAHLLGVSEEAASTDIAVQNLQAMFLSLDSDKNPDNGISLPDTISNIPSNLDLTSGSSMAAAVLAVDPSVSSVDPVAAENFFKSNAELLSQKYTKIGDYEAYYVFDDYNTNSGDCPIYTSATMSVSHAGTAKHYDGVLMSNNTPIDQFSGIPDSTGDITTNQGRRIKVLHSSKTISIWDGSSEDKKCRSTIGMRNINSVNSTPHIGVSKFLAHRGNTPIDNAPSCDYQPPANIKEDEIDDIKNDEQASFSISPDARTGFYITTSAMDTDGFLTSATLKIYRDGKLTDTLNILTELTGSGDRPSITRRYTNDSGPFKLITYHPSWNNEQDVIPYQISTVYFNVSCYEDVQFTIELKDDRNGVSNYTSEVFEAILDGEPNQTPNMAGQYIGIEGITAGFSNQDLNSFGYCYYEHLIVDLSRINDIFHINYTASGLNNDLSMIDSNLSNNDVENNVKCPEKINDNFTVNIFNERLENKESNATTYFAEAKGIYRSPIFGNELAIECTFGYEPESESGLSCYQEENVQFALVAFKKTIKVKP